MNTMMQPAVALPMGYPSPYAMQQPVYVSSLSQIPAGAVPVSQDMMAQALGQGQLGAQAVQPTASPLKSMIKGLATGAVAGAAFGVIPFLPLGLISGGIVGAIAGAAIGLMKGVKAKRAEAEFRTMNDAQIQAQATQAQMNAATPAGARNVAATAKPHAVVMSPAMRKKWAAKVAAERAAAAKR